MTLRRHKLGCVGCFLFPAVRRQSNLPPWRSRHFQTVHQLPLHICAWHASDLWTDGKYTLVNIYTAFTKPLFQSVIGALQMFIIVGIDPCLSMQRLDPGKVNWKTRQQNSWETFSHAKLKVCSVVECVFWCSKGRKKVCVSYFIYFSLQSDTLRCKRSWRLI